MGNITKNDLVAAVAADTGFLTADVKCVVESFMDTILANLYQGHTIEIRGFGTFACKRRKGRPARNPRTQERINIPGRLVPTLKFSPSVRAEVEKGDGTR